METNQTVSSVTALVEGYILGDLPPVTVFFLVRAGLPALLFALSLAMWSFYHNHSLDPSLKLPLPPGSMGLPIIGETLNLLLSGGSFYENRVRKYGNVFKTHLLGAPIIRVSGAQNVKKILMSENNLVTVYWPTSVRILLGHGTVSNAVGDVHRLRRRALQKAFTYNAMEYYVPIMQKVVTNFIQRWCGQDSVLGYAECKHMSFAVAAEALVGFDLTPEAQCSLVQTFNVFVENLFCFPVEFPGLGLAKGMNARRELLNKIQKCLEQKMHTLAEERESGEDRYTDAISRLLEFHGEGTLSMDELKDLSLELLFAGHATCASAATSLLIQLNKNSSVIDKILEEIESYDLIHPETGDLNLATLGKLRYVTAVVKEILRIAPPVGGAFRTVLKSFPLNGYQVPAGWTVAYSIRETHAHTEVFSEHDKFDPSRWLDHVYTQDEKYHYLPFGGGTRACVGKEFAKIFLRVFIVELVRSCKWQLVNGSTVQIRQIPVPHPSDGLPVRFFELSGNNRPRSNTF